MLKSSCHVPGTDMPGAVACIVLIILPFSEKGTCIGKALRLQHMKKENSRVTLPFILTLECGEQRL